MEAVIDGWSHVGRLLEAQAERYADKTYLAWHRERYTYREVNARADRYRSGLELQGVVPGQPVGIMMGNCPEYVFAMFALAKAGAVDVGLNPETRGSSLARQLELAGVRVLLLDSRSVGAVAEIASGLETLETLVLRSDVPRPLPEPLRRFAVTELADFDLLDVEHRPVADVGPGDPVMLRTTSGTTGPAKMVELSHNYLLHLASEIVWHMGIEEDDVLFSPYPLFHGQSPVCCVYAALVSGSTAALVERFSASQFWAQIHEVGATVFDYIGAALTILAKQPTDPYERDNTVRLAHGGPTPANWRELQQRFGLRLSEMYGSTEACCPTSDPLGEEHRESSCGRVCEHHEVSILGDGDQPCPVGEVGEIAVRPRAPFTQMSGYWKDPAATVVATRNFWCHTGDLGYLDRDGYLYFTGRKKDAIRRRGQNISAFEIEAAVERDDRVLEAAAIGVPSELTEEDVKVLAVPAPGATLRAEDVLEVARASLAGYMVPRYVEVVPDLPKGPSGKVNKYLLKEDWRTAATLDAGPRRKA